MKKISLTYVLLASVLWGTSGLFVKGLAPYGFTSLQMTFFRCVIALICMGVYALIRDRKLLCATPKELLLFAGGGLGFLGTAGFYFYAMQLTSVSTAVVLMYTAPIFVMIYSVFFLGEKFTKIKGVSVLCTILGCVLVSGVIGGLKFDAVGIMMGLMAGISYSAFNIFTKIQMKNNSNPITSNIYCFFFATVIGAFISNPSAIPECIAKDMPVTILLVIAMGICTAILPYFFYTMALRDIPAGTAASLAVVEPMSATLFSIMFLGEKPSVTAIVGIVLILSAVYLLSKEEL